MQPVDKDKLRDLLLKQSQDQPLDNMIGFKQRTDESDLRKWEKNLNINNDMLTSQCDMTTKFAPTEKEERKMIREIKNSQRREAKLKHAKLIKKLRPA